MAGDGQVTMGDVVMKHSARKIRQLRGGQVLAGFAGSTADALTLFDKFENMLERYQGNSGYFLPMGAKFIVGQDGLIKARQVNIEFRERMEPEAVLAVLRALR